jgi:uncharacterized protein
MGKDKKEKNTDQSFIEDATRKMNQSKIKSGNLFEDSKHPGSFYFTCAVKPNARDDRIDCEGNQWILSISSPPVKGKANADIINFLSHKLGIAKNQIQLIKGEISHLKTFYITTNSLTLNELQQRLLT